MSILHIARHTEYMRSRSRDCGSLLVALKLRQPKSWCTLKALTARPAAPTNKLTRINTSSQRGLSTPPGRMRASTALIPFMTKVQLAPVNVMFAATRSLHCSCENVRMMWKPSTTVLKRM